MRRARKHLRPKPRRLRRGENRRTVARRNVAGISRVWIGPMAFTPETSLRDALLAYADHCGVSPADVHITITAR